jgi:hypothetical protein
MECLHISLEVQAVGTMVGPQFGTRSVVYLPRHSPPILALVVEKRAAMPCRYGTVFQALFDLWRCHLHKAVCGRVRILPIHSRRRGICPRGN